MKLSPPTGNKKSTGSSPQTASRRERDDNYVDVVIPLASRWRIIVCKDRVQFVLQQRSVAPPNTGTWSGKSYSTTRDGLVAACSRRGLLSEPSARQVLEALLSDVRDYASQMGLPSARLEWPEGNDAACQSNPHEAAKASSK